MADTTSSGGGAGVRGIRAQFDGKDEQGGPGGHAVGGGVLQQGRTQAQSWGETVLLWRMYFNFELCVNGDAAAAKRVFLRAVRKCPGSKRLWLEGGIALRPYMAADEARLFVNMMAEKELLLREELND